MKFHLQILQKLNKTIRQIPQCYRSVICGLITSELASHLRISLLESPIHRRTLKEDWILGFWVLKHTCLELFCICGHVDVLPATCYSWIVVVFSQFHELFRRTHAKPVSFGTKYCLITYVSCRRPPLAYQVAVLESAGTSAGDILTESIVRSGL